MMGDIMQNKTLPQNLIGKQVVLRPITVNDIAAVCELGKDREISRFTFMPYPYTVKDGKRMVEATCRGRVEGTAYNFLIIEKPSNRVAGMIHLGGINKRFKRAETGYWIGKEFRRKGMMSEALRLVVRFAFKELGLHRIAAYVFLDNEKSIKLLEKVGFRREGVLRDFVKHHNKWRDCIIYSMLRREYR